MALNFPDSPSVGDTYNDTNSGFVYEWDGTIWKSLYGAVDADISADSTPQLGGDLDLNSRNITGTGNINITGIITATSFVKTSGTSSQFLKADGSVDSSVYITSADGGNADQLDGQEGTYYLDYDNFTNTPTIPTNNNQLTNGAGFITSSDNITGTSGGLTGSPSITVTDITAVGNVSIAGTLTYEDVTSVDSVGLVTARTGVRVTTGGIEVSNGGAAITGVVTATSFDGGAGTFSGDVDIADKIVHTGDTDTSIRFPAADTFTVETAGSERVRIDSSGRMGVGTQSPQSVLHVKGSNAEVTTQPNADTESTYLTFRNAAGTSARGFIGYNYTDNYMNFRTNGAGEKMRIDSSGKMVIGTTSASHKLTVIDRSTPIALCVGENDNATTEAGIRIQARNTANTSGYNLDISVDADAPAATFDFAGSERMRIDSLGRFGIGTTSPGRQLQINGDSDTQIRIVASTGGNAGIQFGDTSDVVRGGVNFDASDNSLQLRGYNNSEAVRIDSSGRMGLGTQSPQTRLHVIGTTRIANSGTNDAELQIGAGQSGNRNAYIDLVGDNTYTDYGLRLIRSASGANADSTLAHRGTGQLVINAQDSGTIAFRTANTERARITSSGNFGIGSNNPLDKLTVQQGSDDEVIVRINGADASTEFCGLGVDNGSAFVIAGGSGTTSTSLVFKTSNNGTEVERLRIAAGGAIGLSGANYGTSGQVMTSNGSGSAPTWQDAGGGAWNLISTVTASSASTVDFTSGINSTYKVYKLIGSNLTQNGFPIFECQFYNNGTLVSGSNYRYNNHVDYVLTNGTTNSINDGGNLSSKGRVSTSYVGSSIAYVGWEMTIYEPSLSRSSYLIEVRGSFTDASGNNPVAGTFQSSISMYNSSFTNINGIRILPWSSNTMSGTFKLYGIS